MCHNEFMFCQAGSVENEPIRIRVGGGEDSKTGEFFNAVCHSVNLGTDVFYSCRF